jgi:hypothetical protein
MEYAPAAAIRKSASAQKAPCQNARSPIHAAQDVIHQHK